jgi:hypothetical protein
MLSPKNILDYIIFFFNHVSGPDGNVYVIEDPQDHPALGSLSFNQMDDIIAHHQAPEIAVDPEGTFTVKTSLYYLGSLVRATIRVDKTGRVNVADHQMLLSSGSGYSEEGTYA